MSWIGISDGRHTRRAVCWSGGEAPLLSAGSLLVEAQFRPGPDRRQTLVALRRQNGWIREFRLSFAAAGNLLLEHRQGAGSVHALLAFPPPEGDNTLRITITWDAPERIGVIALENLDTGEIYQKIFDAPHPWPVDDVAALIGHDPECSYDRSLSALAVSDHMQPIGWRGGILAGTLIDTPQGPRQAQDLRPGDRVYTYEHGAQPVRAVLSREVPTLGQFAPVRLSAPFFGLTRDLAIARDHRIRVSGADAEYLFGTDSVLIEAGYLQHMIRPAPLSAPLTTRYMHLLMDAHMSLSMAGTWGESLFLGKLADDPARLATSALSGYRPETLPRHTRIAGQELRKYEAVVLVSALCA